MYTSACSWLSMRNAHTEAPGGERRWKQEPRGSGRVGFTSIPGFSSYIMVPLHHPPPLSLSRLPSDVWDPLVRTEVWGILREE